MILLFRRLKMLFTVQVSRSSVHRHHMQFKTIKKLLNVKFLSNTESEFFIEAKTHKITIIIMRRLFPWTGAIRQGCAWLTLDNWWCVFFIFDHTVYWLWYGNRICGYSYVFSMVTHSALRGLFACSSSLWTIFHRSILWDRLMRSIEPQDCWNSQLKR